MQQFIDLISHVNEVGLLMFFKNKQECTHFQMQRVWSVFCDCSPRLLKYNIFNEVSRHHLIKQAVSYKKILIFPRFVFLMSSKVLLRLYESSNKLFDKCNINMNQLLQKSKGERHTWQLEQNSRRFMVGSESWLSLSKTRETWFSLVTRVQQHYEL